MQCTSTARAGAGLPLPQHLCVYMKRACSPLQAHVARGGALHRVDEPLVLYRYHVAAASHAIPRRTIHLHRVRAIEEQVRSLHVPYMYHAYTMHVPCMYHAYTMHIPCIYHAHTMHIPRAIGEQVLRGWPSFSIWGAGRDGREFFKALRPEMRSRVAAFCDVDPNKVGTPYQYFEWFVPVVHFRDVRPPFVTCVALDRTGGAFEANLASLGLTEGVDYFLFG